MRRPARMALLVLGAALGCRSSVTIPGGAAGTPGGNWAVRAQAKINRVELDWAAISGATHYSVVRGATVLVQTTTLTATVAGAASGDTFVIVAATAAGDIQSPPVTLAAIPGGNAGLHPRTPVAVFSTASTTGLGTPILPLGDVDGDGFGDVFAGYTSDNYKGAGTCGTTTDTGATIITGGANVFFGTSAGTLSTTRHWFVCGATGNGVSYFGMAAVAADFNGDGKIDLAVGAPGKNDVGAAQDGTVSIFLGNGSSIAFATAKTQIIAGIQKGAGFGYRLAIADSDGNGLPDLVVDHPTWNKAGATTDYAGAVSIVKNNGSPTVPFPITSPTPAMTGLAKDHLGTGLDAPSLSQIVIGKPQESGGGSAQVCSPTIPATCGSALTVPGLPVNAGFGSTILHGDFDGNGTVDLAFPVASTNKLYVFMNGSASALTIDSAGKSAAVGDLNADGYDDVVSAAHGGIDVRYGGPAGLTGLRNETVTWAHTGTTRIFGGEDIDGDSSSDFFATVATNGTTTLFVVRGPPGAGPRIGVASALTATATAPVTPPLTLEDAADASTPHSGTIDWGDNANEPFVWTPGTTFPLNHQWVAGRYTVVVTTSSPIGPRSAASVFTVLVN